jgi:hypothetical protein
MELARHLASRGHPDAGKVLGVALRDVVHLHSTRRVQEFELCVKSIAHCIDHVVLGEQMESQFLPVLIRTYNKLLDKHEIKNSPLNIHLVLQSVMLHHLFSGPDAALADLARKTKSFSNEPEIEELRHQLQVASSMSAPIDASTHVRMWLDELQAGILPADHFKRLLELTSPAVQLPDSVWTDAVIAGIPLLSVLAKRRRSQSRFHWTPEDLDLVFTAIECQPNNPVHFQVFLDNFDDCVSGGCAAAAQQLLWRSSSRVQLWVSLFWRPRARRHRSGEILALAGAVLRRFPEVNVATDIRRSSILGE